MSDRAERLRQNRKASKEKVQSQTSESSKPSKPSESEQTDEPDESDETPVKEEQVGTYFYLPEGQHDKLGYRYKMLSAEYEREFSDDLEKNRHFYPLVVEYGLDGLDSADAQDVREMLDGLDY